MMNENTIMSSFFANKLDKVNYNSIILVTVGILL